MREYPSVIGTPVLIAMFLAVVVGPLIPMGSTQVTAAEMEKPADIVATQIRRQGYECGKAQSAERDREASKVDETV